MKEFGNGFEKAVQELKKIKAKRIFVHFPEGLKLSIQKIAEKLEKEGFEVVLCLEKTYGACDVRDDETKRFKCDAILHIAHQDYGVKSSLPVVYWDYFIEANAVSILEKEFAKLKNYKNIGLVTSVQFVKSLPAVAEFLEKKGKKVFLHKSLQYTGQMLGCRIGSGLAVEKNVDVFLCISAGKFYGLGLALFTKKPLLNLDLETQSIYSLDAQKEKIEKIIVWNKQMFKEAKSIGLLVSWKKGQMFGNPFRLKNNLEKQGKKVYILAMDEISSEKIEGLKLDFLVNFACPRIEYPEFTELKTPMLNWYQVENKI
jgi:2-(3-amino-3-carboxypropyl)histidine synthase